MTGGRRPPLVWRIVKGFGQFWWDFLIGDTPELFVAALVTIGVVAVLSRLWHWNGVAALALPVLATSALVLSIRRAVRGERRR